MGRTRDTGQYRPDSIEAYERIYGRGFVSPGGVDTARELVARLQLEPGQRVLDVGCGLGGCALVMAETGAHVNGIDVSENMLAIARARLVGHRCAHLVHYEHGDCLELDRTTHYDAVHSRDAFLHIHDKDRLFAVLKRALRPGGRLLFTDYTCAPEPWPPAFRAYVDDRGYRLHTLDAYVALLERAGFEAIEATDRTDRFLGILQAEHGRLAHLDLDDAHRAELDAGWSAKIERARAGTHRWALLEARAPAVTSRTGSPR